MKKKLVLKISWQFSENLLNDIGESNLKQAITRNRLESDTGICHTHDFCDANMTMASAFKKVVGRQNDMGLKDSALWNTAWNLAMKNCFYIEMLIGG